MSYFVVNIDTLEEWEEDHKSNIEADIEDPTNECLFSNGYGVIENLEDAPEAAKKMWDNFAKCDVAVIEVKAIIRKGRTARRASVLDDAPELSPDTDQFNAFVNAARLQGAAKKTRAKK